MGETNVFQISEVFFQLETALRKLTTSRLANSNRTDYMQVAVCYSAKRVYILTPGTNPRLNSKSIS